MTMAATASIDHILESEKNFLDIRKHDGSYIWHICYSNRGSYFSNTYKPNTIGHVIVDRIIEKEVKDGKQMARAPS